jgi:hypothetical protein
MTTMKILIIWFLCMGACAVLAELFGFPFFLRLFCFHHPDQHVVNNGVTTCGRCGERVQA